MRISDWSSDVCSSDLTKSGKSSGKSKIRLQNSNIMAKYSEKTQELVEETMKRMKEGKRVMLTSSPYGIFARCIGWLRDNWGISSSPHPTPEEIGRAHV